MVNPPFESYPTCYREQMGTRVIYFSDTGFTFFVLLMALNRFAVFVAPKVLFLFSKWVISNK